MTRMIRRISLTRLFVAALVVVLAVVAVTAVDRYRGHSRVRDQAFKALQRAALDASASPNPLVQVSSSSAGLGDAGANPGVPLTPSLPIGSVVAANPRHRAVPSHPSAGSVPARGSRTNGSSSGSTGGPSPEQATAVSIAVLTPLLSTFKFGASVGFLLACNTAAGTLSAAASQVPGLSAVLAPVIAQIGPVCNEMSDEAVTGLNTANEQLRVLQALNPGTAPYFAQFDKVFAAFDAVAPKLEPLTGVITTLGPLVHFFSGMPNGS